MSEPQCYSTVQLCAMRVAKLDAAGAPDAGTSNGYITDATIEATIGVEMKEGADLEVENGCGSLCAAFKDCDRVKRSTVTMNLCTLDSELLSLLIGGTVFSDLAGAGVGDTIGYELPKISDACPYGVCLEFWTKAWDGAQQATPPFAGGTTPVYFHFVLPRAQFQLGSFDLKNEFGIIPVEGFGDENENVTADGPYEDWPADIASAGGITSALGWFFDSTLPTAACGFAEVTSAAS